MDWDLLASLPDGDRAEILAAAARRTFNRGEMLVHAGDRADSLHLIVEGRDRKPIEIVGNEIAGVDILQPKQRVVVGTAVRIGRRDAQHNRVGAVLPRKVRA